MHDLNHNEDRPRGTYEFPFEFHHIDHTHPRYVMSYHWHVEYEIIRILEGNLTVTLDEKSFTAVKNDVIFVHSGILHSGIPDDCVYQCIVFDMNTFLKNQSCLCRIYTDDPAPGNDDFSSFYRRATTDSVLHLLSVCAIMKKNRL